MKKAVSLPMELWPILPRRFRAVGPGCGTVFAQDSAKQVDGQKLSEAEYALYEIARDFSRSTLTDGKGWESYESFFHPDFSRRSSGNGLMSKQQLVESIRQWWP